VTLYLQNSPIEAKREFLEALRARYEKEGFTFTTYPYAAKLPDFLGSYVPDALAQKPGHNVAIEVKSQKTPSTDRTLRNIRRLFDGRSDWQFRVVFMGTDPLQSLTIPTAGSDTVRTRVKEVRALIAEGHLRPAFLMAWTLLEAALRTHYGEGTSRPRTPGTVVQTLAMNGYIEPEVENRLRTLIVLRNRIAHGDLDAEPATPDIEQVLSAIEETLSTGRPEGN